MYGYLNKLISLIFVKHSFVNVSNSSNIIYSNNALSIGHVSPEAAEGGAIGLVEEGDIIDIDIPNRSINVRLSDEALTARRVAMDAKGKAAWKPVKRERQVSAALKAYAAMTTSAARGAVRDVSQLEK